MNGTTNLLSEWNLEESTERLPNTIIIALLLTMGIIGNTLVIIIYSFRLKHFKKDRYFIPILAFADLLACVVSSVFSAIENSFPVDFPSAGMCRGFWFSCWFVTSVSMILLLVIALNRYLKICRPHGRQMSLFWKRISVGISTLVAFVIMFPTLFYFDEHKVVYTFRGTNISGRTCAPGSHNHDDPSDLIYFASVSVINAITVFITFFLYISIGKVIYEKFQKRRSDRQNVNSVFTVSKEDISKPKMLADGSSDGFSEKRRKGTVRRGSRDLETMCNKRQRRQRRVRIQFNHMFLTIFILSVVANTPPAVFLFLHEGDDLFWLKLPSGLLNLFLTLHRMFIINHVFNPFIYGYFDLTFRKEVKKLMISIFKRCRSCVCKCK